jgi:methionine sulfoxide reductase heme-binding subunit
MTPGTQRSSKRVNRTNRQTGDFQPECGGTSPRFVRCKSDRRGLNRCHAPRRDRPVNRHARIWAAIGLILIAAFLAQDFFALKWSWLVEMQADENFKRLTGFLLVAYILHQWALSVERHNGTRSEIKLTRHMAWGGFAPLVFYFHTHQLGYAYLVILSTVFLLTVSVGLLSRETVGINKKWYLVGWMVVHVCLSVLLVMLAGYHAFIAFYYQ